MARDRKRAKQRQRRGRGATAAPDSADLRVNVPEAVQHSGEVDEFDAALVRGARPIDEPVDEMSEVEANGREDVSLEGNDFSATDIGLSDDEPGGGLPAAPASGAVALPAPGRPGRVAQAQPSRNIFQKAIAFLQASWAELQRVQWPDRRHVAQATAVVLGFVVVAGVYLGAADWVAQKIVNFVL